MSRLAFCSLFENSGLLLSFGVSSVSFKSDLKFMTGEVFQRVANESGKSLRASLVLFNRICFTPIVCLV